MVNERIYSFHWLSAQCSIEQFFYSARVFFVVYPLPPIHPSIIIFPFTKTTDVSPQKLKYVSVDESGHNRLVIIFADWVIHRKIIEPRRSSKNSNKIKTEGHYSPLAYTKASLYSEKIIMVGRGFPLCPAAMCHLLLVNDDEKWLLRPFCF
jgi:hypothetical protein